MPNITQDSHRRNLPPSMSVHSDSPNPSQKVKNVSPDKVLEYSCAVISDGLLLLELRDGIHEGDGKCLERCWKFMLLYFFFSGHKKYALEALKLQAALIATVNDRLSQEILHSRFINTQGGEGNNIPTDLYGTLKSNSQGLYKWAWS